MAAISGLGTRIRALRKARALTLEGLATRSGIGASILSKLENGKGGSTVETHRKIAEALGVSLAELFRGLGEPEPEVAVTTPAAEDAAVFTYDEKASAILLTSHTARKQMLPQLLVLRPGGQTAVEQYPKGTERWLLCEEGAIEARVGEKRYRIVKGGTLYFRGSLPHQLRNTHRAVAKVISVTAPAVL